MWTPVVLVLLCGLSGSSQLQAGSGSRRRQPPPGKLDFGYVPAGVYETVAHYEPGPIGILFQFVHAFLSAVQPNPFPEELVVKLAQDRFQSIQKDYKKALHYEIGFLVCVALGLLFIVLMPLVGLFFCLCRCCNNCGGEMHQRQRKNADCKRGLLGTLLFSTSLIITLGILCAYAANQNLSSQVKNIRRLVNSNMKDVQTFTNDTTKQIDYLISQYATAQDKVTYDLDNIGPILGGSIRERLTAEVRPALDSVLIMATEKIEKAMEAMQATKSALENASISLKILQDATVSLQSNLTQVHNSITRTLENSGCLKDGPSGPVPQCQNIEQSSSQLQISADFSQLPSVTPVLERMNALLKTNLSDIVQRGYASLNETPQTVAEQTKTVVKNVQDLLGDIGDEVSKLAKKFPVQRYLNDVTIFINQAHAKIEAHYADIDRIDFYRWIACIALCCMVVLILAFNYLGLLCGTLGYDKHASPTTRGCISNTGGTMLMAGVGFSFIFSWLLMGAVTALFLVVGNVEKLVCEPYQTKELFKVVDAPYMIRPEWRYFIPGYLYNDPDLNLTVEDVYSDCKENKGIYTALRMDTVFNITSYLNDATFTNNIVGKLSNFSIDLKGVVLFESEGRENLLNFSQVGLADINYTAFLTEVNKNITKVDLTSVADQLDTEADKMPDARLRRALKGDVETLRLINSQQVVSVQQATWYGRARAGLNESMKSLQRTASDLPSKVAAVISAVDAAQDLISHNATLVVQKEFDRYKATLTGYFYQYIEWVKTSLNFDVAPCKPFSNILDTAEIIACSFAVDSMNSFWLGLGCSALFLIPSIILGVKLAKYYRRMDTEDVYDDMEIGNNGYHSERLQSIPSPMMPSIPAFDTMNRFPRASAPPRHIDC